MNCPAMPDEAEKYAMRIAGCESTREERKNIWRLAWMQRDVSLRSFTDDWRELILLAKQQENDHV